MCEAHLYKDISINSVAEILALVDHYNARKLKDISPRFFFFENQGIFLVNMRYFLIIKVFWKRLWNVI